MSNTLTKREFLEFLKRQRHKNTIEGILPPVVDEPEPEPMAVENNNADAKHSNVNTNLYDNEHPKTKEGCVEELGYKWNQENMICENLTVTFYTQEGETSSKFELSKGNYDGSEISNFEFKPSFMAVPLGLRVKIWEKPGYVGTNLGFLGNNLNNGKKHLYPIDKLGSIQICNMKSCVKPSEFADMTLISLINGDNIDSVETNVSNLGEYKERLREKIHQKLMDVRMTHNDCLSSVSNYLASRDINIENDLSKEENSFMLQKILHEITNLPSCEKIKELKPRVLEEESVPIFSPIESIMERMSPSVSQMNVTKEEETQFETDNLKFIIFLFVFLLIILIVSALIYFYLM